MFLKNINIRFTKIIQLNMDFHNNNPTSNEYAAH